MQGWKFLRMEGDGGRALFRKQLKSRVKQRVRWGKGPVVLVQVQHQPHLHLILSELVPALEERFGASAVAFSKTLLPVGRGETGVALRKALAFWVGQGSERLYRDLGCESYLIPRVSRPMAREASLFADEFLRSGPSKTDLEDLKIGGVHVGDLVYDSFLRLGHYTIRFNDPGLKALLVEAAVQVGYWKNYLSRRVAAVVCDGAYVGAVVSRVAATMSVPCFSLTPEAVYRLTTANPIPYREDRTYWDKAIALSGRSREKALREGQAFIGRRLAGYIDHRTPTLKNSPYGQPTAATEIQTIPRRKVRVMVAAHDFFDSPHIFGKGFFPDYFEWLVHIRKIALETDYDWFVKPHPVSSRATVEAVHALFSEVPSVNVVDPETSTHSLLEGGVRFALTCSGTIASELPALGVTVIHASANHCHPEFGFSVTPAGKKEYEDILRNLEGLRFEPNIEDLYLFHYFDGVLRQGGGAVSQYWMRTGEVARAQGQLPHESYGPLGPLWALAQIALRSPLHDFLLGQDYRSAVW